MRDLFRGINRSWLVLPALVLVLGAAVGIGASSLTGGDDSGDGGSDSSSATAPNAKGPPPAAGKGAQSFLVKVIPRPAGALSGARPPSRIAKLVKSMPLERKVAQLMIVGFDGTDANAPILAQLKRYDWGGLMVGENNYAGDLALRALSDEIRNEVARLKHVQPLLMATQQGGEYNAIPALPPEFEPSETESVVEAAELAATTGRTLRRVGLDAIFAPSLEVGPEDGGAMGGRAYSDEPDQVAAYAQATVEQYRRARILAAAGRFPGLGAATQSPEEGPPNVGLSVDELRSRDLVPYRAAIRAGVPAVVVGNGLYATDDFVTPASQSKAVIGTLLRGQLGFRGLAIADDLTQPAITTSMKVPDAAVASIGAGIDIVIVNGEDALLRQTYDALLAAAKSGKLSSARIDEALTRGLVAKSDLGLLRKRKVRPKAAAGTPPGTAAAPAAP